MYKGIEANIVFGRGGFNNDTNPDAVPITHLITAENVRYTGNTVAKAGGLIEFDADGILNNPDIVALHDWHPTTAIQNIITVCGNNKVYKEESGNQDAEELTAVADLEAQTGPIVFVDAGRISAAENRKLLLFADGMKPRVFDDDGTGTSAAFSILDDDLSQSSPDWTGTDQPAGAIYHDYRVFAWKGHTLYASTIDDHTQFNPTNPLAAPIYPIAPGQGDEIRCCFSYLRNRLYVLKYPYGLYYLDTSGLPGLVLPTPKVRDDVGGAGPNAVTRVGGLGVFFISSNGHIYNLEALMDPNLDLTDADITAKLNLESWITDNVDLSRLKYARLVYHETRKEVWAIYTSKTSPGLNDLCLVINIEEPRNPKIAVENRGEYFEAFALYRESDGSSEVICGGDGGLVYRANQASATIGSSTGYETIIETPYTDFGYINPQLRNMKKRIDWITVNYIANGSYSVLLDVFVDDRLYDTYTFTTDGNNFILGSGILDTTAIGTGGPGRDKFRVGGRGRRIKLRFRHSAANESFELTEAIVGIKPLGKYGESV